MAYIKNPNGRISEIEDDDVNKWLLTPGFSIPTPEEVQIWIDKRTLEVSKWKEEERINRENYGKPGVYMVTVSQGGKDGYGIASKNIIKELQALGVNIQLHNEGQKIALLFHAPFSIQRLENPVKILFTMFESDKWPDEWNEYLELADKIIVPSKWCQEVAKKSGFPTDVIPLGYNDDVFKLVERTQKRPERKNFTFLHYNAFNIRKGFPEVFKAFTKAFDPSEPVRMIFKTTQDRAPLPIPPTVYPNIEVITGSCKDEDLFNLCARSDAFVFPSRGEGFGITPLEAMATGLPTIVPNAHGITEYFNENFMYEVKVARKVPGIYHRYKGKTDEEVRKLVGDMVVCDVDDLAKQMRWIYEHEQEAIDKGRAAAFYVKQWTFKETAKKLKTVITEYMEKRALGDKPLKNVLRTQQF